MKTLVTLSGYDSTFVLWSILKNTKDEVVAFHMDMSAVKFKEPGVTLERIAAAEAIAVPDVYDWLCANVRPFELRTITITAMNPQGWISLTMIETALAIVDAEPFTRFVYSRSEENNLSANRMNWLRSKWTPATLTPMETPLIYRAQGRPHALKLLPKDLQALMFSCDDPVISDGRPRSCNRCVKCRVTTIAKDMLKARVTPDIIFDYYLKKMGVGPYLGSLSADPDLMPKKRRWIDYPEESM